MGCPLGDFFLGLELTDLWVEPAPALGLSESIRDRDYLVQGGIGELSRTSNQRHKGGFRTGTNRFIISPTNTVVGHLN